MTEGLTAWITLIFLATCWVYWREARFQEERSTTASAAQTAAIQSAYIAIGGTVASFVYRLCFILFGIPYVMEHGRAADTSQLSLAIVFAISISGGLLLIERATRGISLHAVDRKLKLNNTSLSLFAVDTAKVLLVAAAFGLPLVAGWIWLMETGNEHWWVGAWILWFVILTIRMLAKPQIETLLFSTATDLPEGALRSRLESLLKRSGIDAASLRVTQASKRTRRVNASVTGLGAHRRIFLHDTLLEQLSADEVEAVVAHEVGHAHYKHLGKAWGGLGLLGLAGAYAIAQVTSRAQLEPAEAVGLLLAAYPSLLLSVRPLFVRISRKFEFQADAFAAMQCGASQVQDALEKIFVANHGVWDHHWAYSAVFDGHPSGRERIRSLQQTHSFSS